MHNVKFFLPSKQATIVNIVKVLLNILVNLILQIINVANEDVYLIKRKQFKLDATIWMLMPWMLRFGIWPHVEILHPPIFK